jgi:hypothetical protein
MQVRASTDLVRKEPEPADAPSLYDEPKIATALDAFEQLLGGRDHLCAELLTSPEITPLIEKVLTLVYDPRFDKRSLGRLCHEAGIRPGEFFAAFRDATIAKANVQVMQQLAQKLPQLADNLLADAVTHTEPCPRCRGTKEALTYPRRTARNRNPDPVVAPCPDCGATGTITVKGDFERQKTVFELVGMLKKGGGISINQQQLTMHKGGGEPVGEVQGGLAQLHQALSGLRPSPPPSDPPADVVEGAVVSSVHDPGV